MKRIIKAFLAVGLLLPMGAQAGVGAVAGVEETSSHLHYTGYLLDVPVMSFSADLSQGDSAYAASVEYHSTGAFGAIFPFERRLEAQGLSTPNSLQPLRYETDGKAGGHVYHAVVHFGAGVPTVENQSPPQSVGDPRFRLRPVPPALTRDSMDHISAVLGLLRQIAAGGVCRTDVHVFDGRMLTDLQATPLPDEMLTATHGSVFAGLAHRCAVTGRMLAGGPPPPPGRERRPERPASAWIAAGPNGRMMLVRVAFETPMGALTFYLDQEKVN